MSTTTTWPGGATDATPTAYTIPASGELNWAALSNFLNVLATSAQSTTAQKWGVRKALTTPVTVSATADCVVVTQLTSPAAVAVTLPAGANKQVFVFVDGTGDAATNNVTITRAGSDTIAGATTLVLNKNRQAVVLVYNSSDTDWKIVGNSAPSSSIIPASGVVSSNGTSLTSAGSDTGDPLLNTTEGTASTPSYSFVGDADTGMYRSGANTLDFATGGSVRMSLDSSGGATIGAGTGNLAINPTPNSASTPVYSFVGDLNTGMYRSAADTINFATSGTSRASIADAGVAIQGTTTNDSAAAGYVGEAVRSAVSNTTVTLTTGTPANVTSISLTAGDWDVSGIVSFHGTITGTVFISTISTTSATIGTSGDNRVDVPTAPTAAADSTVSIPSYRISLSGTTTVYLVAQAGFTVGTLTVGGRISARRVR